MRGNSDCNFSWLILGEPIAADGGADEWKMDILRHSYGTYRLPILKSADALALEMGNSPDVIFRHYRRPMTEVTASVYFDLRPGIQTSPTSNIAPSDAGDESFAKKLIRRRQLRQAR